MRGPAGVALAPFLASAQATAQMPDTAVSIGTSTRLQEALAAMKNAYEAGRATLEPQEREAPEQRIKELE